MKHCVLTPSHGKTANVGLTTMTRPIITTLALLAGCLVLHGAKPAAAADDESRCRRPNIIFLMDDQHRCDHLGVVDPTVKTPALDRLAANGVLFDQAVCQAPMRVPSRYSLMLGLYPPQIGIVSNGPGLSDVQLPCKPLPELLHEAGYQTAGLARHIGRRNDVRHAVSRSATPRLIRNKVQS